MLPSTSLLDDMQVGDLAFFYHSGITKPHIAGIVKLVSTGYVDPLQFDPNSKYYDATSQPGHSCSFFSHLSTQIRFLPSFLAEFHRLSEDYDVNQVNFTH